MRTFAHLCKLLRFVRFNLRYGSAKNGKPSREVKSSPEPQGAHDLDDIFDAVGKTGFRANRKQHLNQMNNCLNSQEVTEKPRENKQ